VLTKPVVKEAGETVFPPVFDAQSDPHEVADAIATHGVALLPQIVTGQLLDDARREYATIYPAWPDYVAREAERGRPVDTMRADDEDFQLFGPFGLPALDAVPLLPAIGKIVDAVRGPGSVLLQSHLWAKYGQLGASYELPLHADYSNHTVVYPSDDPRFMTVHGIVYYSDVTIADGPTCVLSRTITKDCGLVPYDKPPEVAPELYEQEVPVLAPAGSVMLYSLKLLHRVRAMQNPESLRMTHFFAYGPPDVPWLGWGRFLCAKPGLERQSLLERCSAADLLRLGFPAPGSEYWTEETVSGTAQLYPRLDLAGYLEQGR
jgi:ectoine hydroxylase-related dioxygenase (phytanoyl-CoA dioxygenase family)